MNKLILLILIGAPILLATLTTTTVKALSPGEDAARTDWSQGNGFHPSCDDHGFSSVNDPGFCLSFKTDYILQWAVLALAH